MQNHIIKFFLSAMFLSFPCAYFTAEGESVPTESPAAAVKAADDKLNSTFLANSGSFAIFFRHSLERFITTLFSFPLIRLLPVLKVISGNFLHSFS